jgi:pyrimidine-specific ribonucleoside hydrolase
VTHRGVSTPLIIDTDIGGDPDDTLALAVAALHDPALALVLTTDEQGGDRARFARLLLDLCGRQEVPVVAGPSVRHPGVFVAGSLVADDVPRQARDLDRAAALCDSTTGPVRWLGIGPMTNLARLLTDRPDLAAQLQVAQMGGALNYRHPDRAEHNIRLDVDAARVVLAQVQGITLVPSDVTFRPEVEITAQSPLYRQLATSDHAWAQLVASHLETWFAARHYGSMQHDGLTLAILLREPFGEVRRVRVGLDEIGRMSLNDRGVEVSLVVGADYRSFMAWLERQLA